MKYKKIDICITTYNRIGNLKKILDILSNQTEKDFNLIINDDGSRDDQIINPNDYPIITKYIWNRDDGYHRVGRFNESIKLSVSPKIIILDDDCIPQSNKFVESYINLLNDYDLVRGNIVFPNGQMAHWFSTANLGLNRSLYERIGFFDENFDGNYGYEDIDLGYRIENDKNINICKYCNNDTLVKHGIETYKDGDRSYDVIGKNKEYLENKWNIKINTFGEII